MAFRPALILVFIMVFSFIAHAGTAFWLRGNDETVSAENSIYYSVFDVPPNEFSTKTTITKTAASGAAEWTRFYHETFGTDIILSGNVSVWFSNATTTNPNAKMRFTLYDYDPSTSASSMIVQSQWKTIPNGLSYEDTAAISGNFAVTGTHHLKLLIEYDAPAGTQISLVLDEGRADSLLSWNAPDSQNYQADGVKNSGALLINASGLPSIACIGSIQCADSNPQTIDICYYAGTYSSFCSSELPNCTISCSSNTDCGGQANGVCTKPGSCASQCQYTSGPQIILEEGQCETICSGSSGCDDGISTTTDSCANSGTCGSYCINTQCAIACTSNASCDDSSPITNDVCLNPGTCEAACNNASCNPICSGNPDCDDGSSLTTDVCAGAGRCTAVCESLSSCGNGVCDSGESECSCAVDCGSCGGSITDIYEYACIGNSCQQTIKLGVCGNGRCESGENYFSCEADCAPRSMTVSASFPDNFYVHGETVSVKATVLVDGEKIGNATIRASGFFGDIPLYNDGRHDDGTGNDNLYANSFVMGKDVQQSLYPVTITARIGDYSQAAVAFINIVPKLSFSVGFDRDIYVLGDNLKFEGKLSLKGTEALDLPIDMNLMFGNNLLQHGDINSVGGAFGSSYRTTLLNQDGNYTLVLHAVDANRNVGFYQKQIVVLSPEATNFLTITLDPSTQETYKKARQAKLIVNVKDVRGQGVADALVNGETTSGISFGFEDKGDGRYEGTFIVPQETHSGDLGITVKAVNQSRQGSMQAKIQVLKSRVLLEQIEPERKSFEAGEDVTLRVRATYENGEPFVSENVFALVGNESLKLKGIEKGVYEAKYFVKPSDKGTLSITFGADDSAGGTGEASTEIDVTGTSYLYTIRTQGLTIGTVLVLLIICLAAAFFYMKKAAGLESLKRREKSLIAKIRGVQTQYFVDGSMDKKGYDKFMEEFEAQLQETKESIKLAESKAEKEAK